MAFYKDYQCCVEGTGVVARRNITELLQRDGMNAGQSKTPDVNDKIRQ